MEENLPNFQRVISTPSKQTIPSNFCLRARALLNCQKFEAMHDVIKSLCPLIALASDQSSLTAGISTDSFFSTTFFANAIWPRKEKKKIEIEIGIVSLGRTYLPMPNATNLVKM